uniref:Max dimerization protein 3 n=1 Tax=Myotis lucifugus TaxID=59463 RepID=G1P8B9_MYOLU
MESVASNIQVLLQAAEFLERREREAEHGYASLFPHRSPGPVHRKRKGSPQALGALDSGRSVHNELEKRRRAQLKQCLEQLKQQMPLGADCARYTTLSLLRRARMHIQKLEEQEQRAQRLKEQLRSKQQSLQQQLEQLRAPVGAGERERLRADSLDSSGLSSERSDSDQGECPEAEGGVGSGPGLLTRPVPVQRNWRWTWRAWCSGVRPSCCGASVRARSTATHTAAPGYDPCHPRACLCPQTTLCSTQPGRSPPQASRAAQSLLEWTKRTLAWEPALSCPSAGCCSASEGRGEGAWPPLSPARQAFFVALGSVVPTGTGSLLGPSPQGPLAFAPYCTVFSLKGFHHFLPMVLPDENGETPATKWERGNEISHYN